MPFSLGDYIDHIGRGTLELPNVGAPVLEISRNNLGGGDRVRHVEYRHGKLYIEEEYTSHDTLWTNIVINTISPTEMLLRINKMEFNDPKKTSGDVKLINCYLYHISCTQDIITIDGKLMNSDDLRTYIFCRPDCYKNPINKPIWDLLDSRDKPQYCGDRLFVTSDQRIYIAIIEEQWLEVQASWIKKNERSIPSIIVDEWSAFVNISKLHLPSTPKDPFADIDISNLPSLPPSLPSV